MSIISTTNEAFAAAGLRYELEPYGGPVGLWGIVSTISGDAAEVFHAAGEAAAAAWAWRWLVRTTRRPAAEVIDLADRRRG